VEEEAGRPGRGTTVTASGFLWNRESRRRGVREGPELARLHRGLLGLTLARPGVRLSLRREAVGRREVLLSTGRHTALAAVFREALLAAREERLAESVSEVQHSDAGVTVEGVLCAEPHGSRRLQWLSLAGRPLDRGELHLAVERVFRGVARFQDSNTCLKRFPAFALSLQPRPELAAGSELPESALLAPLVAAITACLEELGLLRPRPRAALGGSNFDEGGYGAAFNGFWSSFCPIIQHRNCT
jgi:hypothetical protein